MNPLTLLTALVVPAIYPWFVPAAPRGIAPGVATR